MEEWKQRLRSAREAKALTKTAFARAVGVSNPTVTDWEKSALDGGIKEISGVKLIKVAEVLGVDANWLLHGTPAAPIESSPTTQGDELEDAPPIMRAPQLIPVVGRVQAGEDGLLHIDDFNADHPEGYLLWYATCPGAYALRIRGESMSPRYLPGEFAGVDPCAEVLPSDEVIVFLKDGRRMIKRLLWARDGQACYESVNKDHPNIVLDCEEIEKMHLVTGHIQKSVFRQNI